MPRKFNYNFYTTLHELIVLYNGYPISFNNPMSFFHCFMESRLHLGFLGWYGPFLIVRFVVTRFTRFLEN